ncbi:hypothetical protein SAY86_030092 [Trapa natans]|uniref:Transcription repressor n=1 Tax=Trapa natans TaxID=22666 RepID=A0AAN7MMI2_TRANT|nr:hypothetical protein SAY86_030092 [Trapa natans]
MGNCRLRLSDMMLSSWFCKLMDVARSSVSYESDSKLKKAEQRPQQQQENGRSHSSHQSHQHSAPPGTFYHFSRNDDPSASVSPSDISYFPVQIPSRRSAARHQRTNPRKFSSKKKKSTRAVTSSVSAGCNCRATLDSVWAKTDPICLYEAEAPFSPSSASSSAEQQPQTHQSFDEMVWQSTSRSFRVNHISNDDVIGSDETSLDPHIELPSTEPLKFSDMVNNVRRPEVRRRELNKIAVNSPAVGARTGATARGFPLNSSAVKLRISYNTPRIVRERKTTTQADNHLREMELPGGAMPDSFAVVKSSADPRREFRESMVEMIVENNIRGSKELEELLTCYLSLNSDEYHEIIISVFKQVWLELNQFIRLK